jgi:hypothetical protein
VSDAIPIDVSTAMLLACEAACEACAADCERLLALDTAYRVGVESFTPQQLALVTCADVCRVTASAIREQRPGVEDVCAWCADVCATLAANWQRTPGWSSAIERSRECAARCGEVWRAALACDGVGAPSDRNN